MVSAPQAHSKGSRSLSMDTAGPSLLKNLLQQEPARPRCPRLQALLSCPQDHSAPSSESALVWQSLLSCPLGMACVFCRAWRSVIWHAEPLPLALTPTPLALLLQRCFKRTLSSELRAGAGSGSAQHGGLQPEHRQLQYSVFHPLVPGNRAAMPWDCWRLQPELPKAKAVHQHYPETSVPGTKSILQSALESWELSALKILCEKIRRGFWAFSVWSEYLCSYWPP